MKQEECHRFEASLGYILSSRDLVRYQETLFQKPNKAKLHSESTVSYHFLSTGIVAMIKDDNKKGFPAVGNQKSSPVLCGASTWENVLIDL